MTTTSTIKSISTGYMTGNMFGSGDWDGYDLQASADKFGACLEAAIEAAYPGVSLTINVSDCSGCEPWDVQTHVDAGDDMATEDAVAEHVNHIQGAVFEDMDRWLVREAVRAFHLPMGAALEEGRAPSHDAEFLTIYYRASDPSEWICESNAGVTATHFHTHQDAEGNHEAEALDTRITEALAGPGVADPAKSCGSEAQGLMIEWGWLKPSQFDGGHILP